MSVSYKSTIASFAVALLATTFTPALAQDAGLYVSGAVGVVGVEKTTVNDTASRKVSFDDGLAGAVALGYDYASPWRTEVELARRAVGLDKVAGANASGDLSATSLMGNVLYDFDVSSRFTPYLGVGVGAGRVNFDNASPFGASPIDDTDTGLAMQAIAGASYELQDNLDLFADYRYFTTRNLDMRTVAGNSASFDVDAHTVMVGLRFSFGAPKAPAKPEPVAMVQPEPAPAPAPMPEPVAAPQLPRNYIVFFDWDKTDITPEAAAIIKTAAANANQMGQVRMVLTGHADRSGPAAYNVKLSKRRGDAVRARFEALGFAPGEIEVIAKGETDPLVPTDDGVREPQNRRVEIVLP
ncbi:OmpA family protein [Magnetovibrio sp.]|uniref:OmpA family protein n=1 Tax=Magnetovibrio sp. TaxID=2024836 RepID=UPI002F92DD51